MNECRKYQGLLMDYFEKITPPEVTLDISEHLKKCRQCQQAYRDILRVHEILDCDDINLPSDEWFESIKVMVKQPEPKRRLFGYLKWVWAPVAAAILFMFLMPRQPKTFDIYVPTSVLLEDEDIARIAFQGLIDDELIADLEGLEQWAMENYEQEIRDMDEDEQEIFIKMLYSIYLNKS